MSTKGKSPVAPAPYRPQPVPKVLQTKWAIVHQPVKAGSRPVAPPVYRPNPSPRVLQSSSPEVLQRKAPFNPSAILQLKVEVKPNGNGGYQIKGRPRFQSSVTKELVAKYNKKNPLNKLPAKGLNLTNEGLARCHKTSWKNIRGQVQDYLNKTTTKGELIKKTDILYGGHAGTSTEWKQMNGLRNRLFEITKNKNSTLKEIETAVNQLCVALNSATPNLRLADAKTNSEIQEGFDPNLEVRPSGLLGFTPTSRGQNEARVKGKKDNKEDVDSPSKTPSGKHMLSSSVDKPFSKAETSPTTGPALFPPTP